MTHQTATDFVAQARAWLAQDPDPGTRAELQALLDADDREGLADRFKGMLEFGTAGLRGELGAGPNRMNRVVVTMAAAGLAAYLKAHGAGAGDSVVIGYDARHNSDVFARDTAEIMTGAGLSALVLPRPLPTPLLAFAIRHLGCVAGVMVTASHNPPQDNGYKVYLGDGSQIVPPADADIAAEIAKITDISALTRGGSGEVLGEQIVRDYEAAAVGILATGVRDLKLVYTPLHGVGGTTVVEVLEQAGFPAAHVVPAQEQPDPDFPTVSFPNPEEPGAIDLAMALAKEVGADIVVANDPDADRCAVAVPTGDGQWRMLRGDEVGALLGDHLLRIGESGVYANSIVSSTLLGKIATAHGQPHQETLTGFKWIGRVEGLRFGYEEALGYCVDPANVRDKDGVTALLRVCELAAALKARGQCLQDRLDEIATTYGVHATDQLSVRVSDLSLIPATMERLRSTPPDRLGGLRVTALDDLAEGSPALPPTDGLRFRLEQGARVIVRPSGTEPKIKCYLEVVESAAPGLTQARASAAARLAAIKADIAAAAGL